MNEDNTESNTNSDCNISKLRQEENGSTSLSDEENDGDLWDSAGSGKITIDTIEIYNNQCKIK